MLKVCIISFPLNGSPIPVDVSFRLHVSAVSVHTRAHSSLEYPRTLSNFHELNMCADGLRSA